MIQFTKILVAWLAVATVAFAQTATISGPTSVEAGRLIVLDSAGSDYTGKVVWDVDDCLAESGSLTWETYKGKLFAAAATPGRYTFKLFVSKGELGVAMFAHTVTVGQSTPPDNPGPVEPPTDPVPPKDPPKPPADPPEEPSNPPVDSNHVSREIKAAADAVNDPETATKLAQIFLDVANMPGTNGERTAEFKRRRQVMLLTRPGPPGSRVSVEGIIVRWTELYYEQQIETPEQLTLFFKACATGLLNSVNSAKRSTHIPAGLFMPVTQGVRTVAPAAF